MKFVTPVINNPKYIEIQYHTLKKYVKCPYEFIVFNDAKDWADFSNFEDPSIKQQIIDTCNNLGITCINIPNGHHKDSERSASQRTGDSCNFITKYMMDNPDKYFLIDSDMFLIHDFDISNYEGFQYGIVLQERYDMYYPWNGLFYIDTTISEHTELINWDPLVVDGNKHCDTGGSSQEWLKLISGDVHPKLPYMTPIETIRFSLDEYATDKLYYIKHLWSNSWGEDEFHTIDKKYLEILKKDPRNKEGKFCCEIYDNKFLHIQGGGRWDKGSKELYDFLTNMVSYIINE
jgi:hypothetical protein